MSGIANPLIAFARAPCLDRRAQIEIVGATKTFADARGASVTALAKVDLTIDEGEFVCLVGPSGCGKTTILNLVAGLEVPSHGTVRVDGHPVRGPGPDRTVMFQDSALFPWLSVRKNVEFPLRVAGVPERECAERVERSLRLVHLWRFCEAQPHELSGGMRQRAALARALVVEPTILLMDEPFAALDAQTRDVLHAELERVWLNTRTTIVFVTHNVREAVRLGDRVVILGTRPGRIKHTLNVGLPRPRVAEAPDVARLSAVVLAELKSEIEKVMREEADDAWSPARSARKQTPDYDAGGGI